MKRWIVVVVWAVLCASIAAAQATEKDLATLDRGHRTLVLHGLQIQALGFGADGPAWWDDWDQGGFTGLDFGGHPEWDGEDPVAKGLPAGATWATWLSTLHPSSLPHTDRLVRWQHNDEQNLGDPVQLAAAKAWFENWRPQLPNTLLCTNQYGDQLSVSALQTYMQECQPDMLYFDTYAFGRRTHVPPPLGGSPFRLYEHMVKYRNLALAGNDGTGTTPIPYGMYLQCFMGMDASGQDEWTRFPSLSELRLQQFAALTFGYTHLTAFIYNNYTNPSYSLDSVFFTGAPRTTDGPTPALAAYGQLNRECLRLGPALVRLQSVDVRGIPGGAYASPAIFNIATQLALWEPGIDPYMQSITATNLGTLNSGRRGDVLVGYFRPLLPELEVEPFEGVTDPFQLYFMITNGLSDPVGTPEETRQSIQIRFDFGDSGIASLQRVRRSDGQVENVPLVWEGGTRYRLDLVLPGGTGDLFRFGPRGEAAVPLQGWPLVPFFAAAGMWMLRRRKRADLGMRRGHATDSRDDGA